MTAAPGATRLRHSIAGDPVRWHERAACSGHDPELFYGPEGERARVREARERRAKAVCARCPVDAECLDYALSTGQKGGIWGGMNGHQRAAALGPARAASDLATGGKPR